MQFYVDGLWYTLQWLGPLMAEPGGQGRARGAMLRSKHLPFFKAPHVTGVPKHSKTGLRIHHNAVVQLQCRNTFVQTPYALTSGYLTARVSSFSTPRFEVRRLHLLFQGMLEDYLSILGRDVYIQTVGMFVSKSLVDGLLCSCWWCF